MVDKTVRWFDAKEATLDNVRGYYFLGYNAQWSNPQIRVGFYDTLDVQQRFRLIGGPHMELAPSHVAPLPRGAICSDGHPNG